MPAYDAKKSCLMSSLNVPGLRPVSCECLLIRGTASDVLGILSETWFRNMVRLRRTVTSENGHTVGLGIRKTVIYICYPLALY